MSPLVNIAIRILEMIALTAAVSGSLFIIRVNLQQWIKNKLLKLSDQLIPWISISNVSYGLIRVIMLILKIYFPGAFSFQLKIKVYMIFNYIFISYNLWLCTWLCVYICLKILNLQNRFYITLRFHDLFLWILIPSVLGSLPISIPLAFGIQKRVLSNKTLDDLNQTPPLARSAEFIVYATVSTAGFLLCSVSALTIVFSLLRHIINLRRNSHCLKGSSIKSHVKAATTVFLLLAANDLSLIFILIPVLQIDKMQWILISMTLYSLLQCMSFLNLIAGNAILNKALREGLKNCLCSQRK
uniref:Taste receptor type 2 n=1 Tax=Leptobrachium leishanense TaxID=445787 RepID=A0A8C5RAP9_9ANUR